MRSNDARSRLKGRRKQRQRQRSLGWIYAAAAIRRKNDEFVHGVSGAAVASFRKALMEDRRRQEEARQAEEAAKQKAIQQARVTRSKCRLANSAQIRSHCEFTDRSDRSANFLQLDKIRHGRRRRSRGTSGASKGSTNPRSRPGVRFAAGAEGCP